MFSFREVSEKKLSSKLKEIKERNLSRKKVAANTLLIQSLLSLFFRSFFLVLGLRKGEEGLVFADHHLFRSAKRTATIPRAIAMMPTASIAYIIGM